ncbi:MAG: hypothetical protein KQH63_13490 [Desulfobulbaceae bacterium]|nr:hypothetical protein [Desulfobulbaceae bacterium]
MNRKRQRTEPQELKLTVGELKGKQSVRATFKLPRHVIQLLSVLAGQLGIKQKSLFDQLIEDASVLGQVAEEARNYSPGGKDRCQKTFVISRNSLMSLDNIAKQRKISRDVLVEVSIRRLLPVIDSELKKHEGRKIVLNEMKSYLEQGQKLLARAGELLGREDRVYEMIQHQVSLSKKNFSEVNSIVEKGKPMEEW